MVSNLNDSKDADDLKSDRKEYMKIKPICTKEHFSNIEKSDAIPVVNAEKHGIKNYIGGATFAEIMPAFHYDKRIFLLNPIPNDGRLSYIKDEVEGVDPVVLNGDLSLITG